MDIITIMTTSAASLRAVLRPGAQAFVLDLSGAKSAFVSCGSGHRAVGIHGSEATHREVGAPFSAKRRPHPTRFFPLSCTPEVA